MPKFEGPESRLASVQLDIKRLIANLMSEGQTHHGQIGDKRYNGERDGVEGTDQAEQQEANQLTRCMPRLRSHHILPDLSQFFSRQLAVLRQDVRYLWGSAPAKFERPFVTCRQASSPQYARMLQPP